MVDGKRASKKERNRLHNILWKIPPKSGGETSKVVDNNKYYFCPKQKSWCMHLPSDCNLSEAVASPAVTDDTNEICAESAMAALLEKNAEE